MPRSKRPIRQGFWVAILFIAIVLFVLITDWWKENAVIGWTILGIMVVAFAFSVYRFASFRGWLGRTVKSTSERIIYEDIASDREPVPRWLRNKVLVRANYKCQNPNCKYKGQVHIHHINMDNSYNKMWNLIALCPNCHTDAHKGKYSSSQLRNWAKMTQPSPVKY